MSRILTLAIIVLSTIATRSLAIGNESSRYEVVLTNGERFFGQRLESLDNLSQLKLDGRELTDPNNHYRWIRSRATRPADRLIARLELVGGDVIPGEILKYVDQVSDSLPALPSHFVILPTELMSLSEQNNGQPTLAPLRVEARYVQRVIWQQPNVKISSEKLGTAISRDGRTIYFRSAKLNADGARVLTAETTRTIAFDDLLQINLPRRDNWEAYFEELAIVNPHLTGRIERIETAGGAIITNSTTRFKAAEGGSEDGLQLFQPAWSLEPILVFGSQIVQRTSFAPHEVPLSRIVPNRVVRRGAFAIGNTWQLDRNIVGHTLVSGGLRHGWGLGVHAYSELHFPLGQGARQFQTRFGLDGTAGRGGCVRARVYFDQAAGQPMFESPFVVGSQSVHELPAIALPTDADAVRTLVLQVDSAHEGRPRGADPLDVRDMFNWLEPIVELDAEWLRQQVQRRATQHVPAWQGWTVHDVNGAELRITHQFDQRKDGWGRYEILVQPTGGPLVLTKKTKIDADAEFLTVAARGKQDLRTGAIRLEIDGKAVAARRFPRRQPWQKFSPPIVFPVCEYKGKDVAMRLVQSESGSQPLRWQAITIGKSAPREYLLQDTLNALNESDLAVNLPMGQLLSSKELKPELKKTLYEISQQGGYVNFVNRQAKEFDGNRVSNVLLGKFWKGGDESCKLLEKLDDIPHIMVAADSGVSDAALERLQVMFPEMSVERHDRTPPASDTHFETLNKTDKEVAIYWIDFGNQLQHYGNIQPGGHTRRHSFSGHRWEAHADGKRISEYVVGPILTWEIK